MDEPALPISGVSQYTAYLRPLHQGGWRLAILRQNYWTGRVEARVEYHSVDDLEVAETSFGEWVRDQEQEQRQGAPKPRDPSA